MVNDDTYRTLVKCVPIELNKEVLYRVIELPKGFKWDKDDKELMQKDKNWFTERHE